MTDLSSLYDSPETTRAVIFSVKDKILSEDEKFLFKEADPYGFILFARNCEDPEQVRALTDSLREVVGRNCPILIDQEGGRVQRLKPPLWRQYPPFQTFGLQALEDEAAALDSLRFETLQLAEELLDAGVSVNCSPVLDVLMPETHDVIGDRAFSDQAEIVGRLGLSVCRHFLAAGIVPIIKHIPGHGRATADSHLELPRVRASAEELDLVDFAPFKTVSQSEVGAGVWAMTAHIIYEALDVKHCASASPTIIKDVIRDQIGFEGILLSDDLDMKALDCYGDVGHRAEVCLEAGCDLALYCAGDLRAMEKLAESVPKMREDTRIRLQKAAGLTKVAV